MPNVALLSFYTKDYQQLADITIPNKNEYCDRYNYQHLICDKVYGKSENYYAFQRLEFLRDILKSDAFDIIWVINIHTMIMNFNKRIEDFVDNEHDFFITRDCNNINGGSFIIKNTKWAKQWLDFLISKEDIHKNHCWYEQKLIIDNWERPEFKDKIKILPQNTINSYLYGLYNIPETTEGQFQKGDLLIHVPGKPVGCNKSLVECRKDVFKSDFIKDNIIK